MNSRNERPPEDRRNIAGKDDRQEQRQEESQKEGREEESEIDELRKENEILKDDNKKLRIDAIRVDEDRHEVQLAVHQQWIVHEFTTFRASIPDAKSIYFHGEEHFLQVDLNSPLHWESRCSSCGVTRTLGSIWHRCPRRFRHLWFGTLREFAICRSVIEKANNIQEHILHCTMHTQPLPTNDLTEAIVEQTIRATCKHALRIIAFPRDGWRFRVFDLPPHLERAYRSGLGEFVDESTSYGTILLRPGLPISDRGGDSSHWEWRVTATNDWEEILEGWISGKRRLKKVLIFWPRTMQWGEMNQLRGKIMDCTATHAWSTVIIPEPGPAETDWTAHQPRHGSIRVIINAAGTDDGTAAWNMQQIHPWIRRDHWEFAAEAWSVGRKWNPTRAKRELAQWGFDIPPEHVSSAEREAERKRANNRSAKKRYKARNSNESKRMKEMGEQQQEGGPTDGQAGQIPMDDWMRLMITGHVAPLNRIDGKMGDSVAGPSTR